MADRSHGTRNHYSSRIVMFGAFSTSGTDRLAAVTHGIVQYISDITEYRIGSPSLPATSTTHGGELQR